MQLPKLSILGRTRQFEALDFGRLKAQLPLFVKIVALAFLKDIFIRIVSSF